MARLYALQLADQRAMEKQGVRENPVRRSGYALQGGAGPDVERFQLASERAGEIQANRTNPQRKGATPTMGVSRVRGGKQSKVHYEHDREGKLLHETMEAHEAEGRAMKGGRAVPSSGLSQFKGGSGIVGGGRHCDDSDSDMEGGARAPEILARESAKRPVIRAGLSDEHSVEAKEMGRHLGKHLKAVRGGGFYDLFTKGIVEAGREGDALRKEQGIPPVQVAPPSAPAPAPAEPTGGALFHRKKDMLGEKEEAHEEHTARRFGMVRKGAGLMDQLKTSRITSKVMEQPTNVRLPDPNRSGSLRQLKSVGGYLSGPYEGMGMSGGAECGGGPARRAKRASKTPAEKEHQKKMKHEAQMKMAEDALDEEDEEIRQRVGQPLQLDTIHRPVARRARRVEAHPRPAQSELTLTGERMDRGSGKKRRAPAGEHDGRRKRAEIVKRVMKEKGMKMIEASKYVKAHNLY